MYNAPSAKPKRRGPSVVLDPTKPKTEQAAHRYMFVVDTMKLSIFLFGLIPSAVVADNMIRVLFNNGLSPTGQSDKLCTSNDMDIIRPLFNISMTRNLRSRPANEIDIHDLDSEDDVAQSNKQRELLYFPPHCKDNCRYYPPDRCMATGCVGYRRVLGGRGNETDSRHLQLSSWCNVSATTINAGLDNLVATDRVSASCKLLLGAPRKFECYNDVKYGVVESFSVYDSTSDGNILLKADAPNGFNFCTTVKIAIEAIANLCVKNVQFDVTGPNGYKYSRFEKSPPFSLFSKNGDGTILNGKKLKDIGTYNITMVPDGLPHKKQDFTFNVVSC
jgi:hypothetical protein